MPVDEANPLASSMVRVRPRRAAHLRIGQPQRLRAGADGPTERNHAARTFTWNLLLVCGDPEAAETYFGGVDKSTVSPISCPDNVAFDTTGNLWISTDGNVLGSNDGIFRVPTKGAQRGRVQQFATVPRGAEACGPLIADGDRSLFVAVQHPGETDGVDVRDAVEHLAAHRRLPPAVGRRGLQGPLSGFAVRRWRSSHLNHRPSHGG